MRRIVILGPPSAGKSTLLAAIGARRNRESVLKVRALDDATHELFSRAERRWLAGQPLVGDATEEVGTFRFEALGVEFEMTDAPGGSIFGEHATGAETKERVRRADAIVLCVDSSSEAGRAALYIDLLTLQSELASSRTCRRLAVVLTKCDMALPSRAQADARRADTHLTGQLADSIASLRETTDEMDAFFVSALGYDVQGLPNRNDRGGVARAGIWEPFGLTEALGWVASPSGREQVENERDRAARQLEEARVLGERSLQEVRTSSEALLHDERERAEALLQEHGHRAAAMLATEREAGERAREELRAVTLRLRSTRRLGGALTVLALALLFIGGALVAKNGELDRELDATVEHLGASRRSNASLEERLDGAATRAASLQEAVKTTEKERDEANGRVDAAVQSASERLQELEQLKDAGQRNPVFTLVNGGAEVVTVYSFALVHREGGGRLRAEHNVEPFTLAPGDRKILGPAAAAVIHFSHHDRQWVGSRSDDNDGADWFYRFQ